MASPPLNDVMIVDSDDGPVPRFTWLGQRDVCSFVLTQRIIVCVSTVVQSAVLRSYVVRRPSVCLSVRLSVCDVGGL